MKFIKHFGTTLFLPLCIFTFFPTSFCVEHVWVEDVCVEKEAVDPKKFLTDSFYLAKKIYDDGFYPTVMISLLRGGGPIGNVIDETFTKYAVKIKNIFYIKTSAYGKNKLKNSVTISSLFEIIKIIGTSDRVLIVDDLVDSGKTITTFLENLRKTSGKKCPEDIRVATVYCKPKTSVITPDYYVHETDKWLVFPHELEELSNDEIVKFKGQEIAQILLG